MAPEVLRRRPATLASGPGSIGRALRAAPADSGPQQEAISGLKERSSRGAPRERERPSGFSTPLALDAERAGSSMIAALVLMAALAGAGPSLLDRCSRQRGGAAAIP